MGCAMSKPKNPSVTKRMVKLGKHNGPTSEVWEAVVLGDDWYSVSVTESEDDSVLSASRAVISHSANTPIKE